MLITLEEEGIISVSMEGYITNILDVYNLSIDTGIKDPQQDNIFIVDESSTLLDEDRRRKYHKVVYMLVYIGKRVITYILLYDISSSYLYINTVLSRVRFVTKNLAFKIK